MNELLDVRHPPGNDPELAAHAAACAPCETLLRSYEVLLEGIASRTAVAPPLGFAECVIAEYSVVAPVKITVWQRSRRFATPALALAATLLIAALPAVLWMRGFSPEDGKAPAEALAGATAAAPSFPEPSSAATSSAAQVVQAAGSDRPTAELPLALVDQARETYEPLIAATSERLASVSGVIPGASARSAPADDSLAQADRGSVDGVGSHNADMNNQFAAGIRPVATSAGRSVVALLRVFPGAPRGLDGPGVAQ